MTRKTQPGKLAPHHASELLSGSGIKHITARRAGIYSESRPAKIAEALGWSEGIDLHLGNCLVFPYRNVAGSRNGYCRLKPDCPRKDRGKYEAPVGQPPRAYFPPDTIPNLSDSKMGLLITEGEKKSLAAAQEGFVCIGIAGVWSWQQKRRTDKNGRPYGSRKLIPDLEAVTWKDRMVFIVFDNDGDGLKPEVRRAESELKKVLAKAGAIVHCVRLPAGPDGEKVGLDDYLVTHLADELLVLMRQAAGRGNQEGKSESEKSEPVPAEKEIKPLTLRQCKRVFRKWLHLPQDDVLDVVLSCMAGNLLPDDPLWLYLVGPPGSGKTELIQALGDHEDAYLLSTFTSASLASGFVTQDGSEPSLLPKLDRKLLCIKDGGTLLGMGREVRHQIYSQLRDIYDGYHAKRFGTGQTKSFKSRFNLLIGVTSAIEKYSDMQAQLGERFLHFRMPGGDEIKRIKKSLGNAEHKVQMRKALSDAARGFLRTVSDRRPKIPPHIYKATVELSNFLATARTDVPRKHDSKLIETKPEPEIGTRLVGQLIRFGLGIGMVRSRKSLTWSEYGLIHKSAMDTMPSIRRVVLQQLYRTCKRHRPTDDIVERLRMPKSTVKRVLEDLHLLGLVDMKSSKTGKTTQHTWQLTGDARDVMRQVSKGRQT